MIIGIIAVTISFIIIGLLIWGWGEFSKPSNPNKFYYIGSYDLDGLNPHKKRMTGNIPKWIRDWIYDLNYREGRHDYRKPDYDPSRKHSTLDSEGIAYLHGRYYSYKLQVNDIHKMLYVYKQKR